MLFGRVSGSMSFMMCLSGGEDGERKLVMVGTLGQDFVHRSCGMVWCVRFIVQNSGLLVNY